MGKSAKKIIQNNNQTKSMGSQKRDNELVQENTRKPLNSKETKSKGSDVRAPSSLVVIDKNVGTEPPEVNENLVIHYMDGAYGSKDGIPSPKAHEVAAKDGKDDDILDDHSDELDKELKKVSEEQSDLESITDSASSQGDSGRADDDKIEDSSRTSRKPAKKVSSEIPKRVSRERFDPDESTSQFKHITPKKPMKSSNSKVLAKGSDNLKPKNTRAYSTSKSSERLDEKPDEKANGETPNETKNGVRTGETDGGAVRAEDIHAEAKEQTSDGASNGGRSIETDSGLDHANDIVTHQEAIVLKEKVESMQKKIEKLEEELREVAALEISLYSVIPEHGSSAHKVHTPARSLSRLYIHACKHWTQSKRATVARNTVSGLILVTRTCGNDVARLTFWLSNTVVLRERISQAFGSSSQSNPMRFIESSGGASLGNGSSLKMLGNSGVKTVSKSNSFTKDWQETRTFLGALEEVESWIFSRVVESVWWQALAPNMQYLVEDLISHKNIGRCLGPALGDQQQGSFSVELWRNAFQDAFQRTCPVRAGGHECGCLPVLARMVMEQCVSRLDVAMFNAILRESANQIPMDPVSDPIVDARVLPIPAGDLSFGSGAQLKNSVGNWCRWLSDFLGMETGHHSKDHQSETKDDNQQIGRSKTKCFSLLNELSELLMLPKDMLMDLSIRKEVCPSISLSLMKRVLCNFSPDEFCPDPVPGEVLEALNAESVMERRLSGDTEGGFPYTASPVIYSSPSSADVAEKVAEAGGKRHIERNASMIQKKGYTSDEELDDLGSPLASFIEKLPSPSSLPNGNAVIKPKDQTSYGGNSRYELLREVWSV